MVFSAELFGAELVVVVVGEDAIVGSVVEEQPANSTAMHATSQAMRTGHTLRARSPSLRVPGTWSAWETIIVATAVSLCSRSLTLFPPPRSAFKLFPPGRG